MVAPQSWQGKMMLDDAGEGVPPGDNILLSASHEATAAGRLAQASQRLYTPTALSSPHSARVIAGRNNESIASI